MHFILNIYNKIYEFYIKLLISKHAGSDGKMITPSGQVTLAEGETLSFNCTSEAMTSSDIILELNSRAVLASENLVAVTTIDNGAAITFGPVRRSHNSGRLRCNFFLFPRSPYTAEIRLNVTCKKFAFVYTYVYYMYI